MEYASSDIISEILLRVPADCITKLKTVCKLWNSVITDSKFIDSHIQRNISNSPQILLFSPKISFFGVINSKSWSISHILLKETTQTPCFGGSCNGLICLYGFETGIAKVINPATQESLNLVKHSTNPNWDNTYSEYCLGFDPSTNKHKVARMCTIFKAPKISSLFEVCNVSDADISWRQIGAIVGAYTNSSGVYCNGGLYWLATGYDESKFWLFYLDLKEEKISIVDETKCDVLFNLRNYKDRYLVQLDGRVCLLASMNDIMNVWMMGDTINDWYVTYRIRIPCAYVMAPLFVTGRKILMRDFVRKELKYYDTETGLYDDESAFAIIDCDTVCCMHVASLAMVNSSKGQSNQILF